MSVTSKSSLSISPCVRFAKDQLFEKVRASLQEKGKLKEWLDIAKKSHGKSVKQLLKEDMMDNVSFHQDRCEIVIDVRGFKPEDVKCSITATVVEVIAQKQEKNVCSSKNIALTRSYQLPQNVKPEEGTCCISSDGILVITAPWLK